ncbi:MAG: hypothetical protein ACFFEK_16190, partial [Candidatus Thorarchaeota archaeon]
TIFLDMNPLKNSHIEAVGKRPSAALASSRVIAAYFYVRLIPRDLSALRLDSPPFGRVPGFGSLASGHFPSASQKAVFRQSRR